MSYRILVTGSEGLIGTALCAALEARGEDVVGLDLVALGEHRGDVRDLQHVRNTIAGCDGVVHLAAVSRVIWGERDPERCRSTNVGGVYNVVEAATEAEQQPWILFASSREVYGQPGSTPATEDMPLRPVNVYGRSKVDGEHLVLAARERGLRTGVVRLSNVYGSTRDHADRVIPAFARAAVLGRTLRVEGADNTFDFTHVSDTVRGIMAFIDLLAAGSDAPPPVHLLTGAPTTLGRLASLSVRLAGNRARIQSAEPRSFDVSRFHGCPARARQLLGWTARTDLQQGLAALIRDFEAEVRLVEPAASVV